MFCDKKLEHHEENVMDKQISSSDCRLINIEVAFFLLHFKFMKLKVETTKQMEISSNFFDILQTHQCLIA